jgi:endo-1,4-beta-xylanase
MPPAWLPRSAPPASPVGLNLPSGATITNAWNANRTGTSGAVQFSNVSYNGRIGAGQSTEFGFQAVGASGNMSPTCSAT